jgi:hypothetical protein
MLKTILTSIGSNMPIVGQTVALVNTAKNVTNCTNPISASVQAVKLIVDVCAPPQVKYPIKCIVLISQLAICFSSGGATSVVTATTTIASARQILEDL